MKEILQQTWPAIERYGPPALGLGLLVATWMLSLYWRGISELRRLERHLHRWGNDRHFEARTLPWVGLPDLLYSVLPLSRLDPILQTSPKGRAELAEMRSLRRVLQRWLLAWTSLGALGVLLNAWLEG